MITIFETADATNEQSAEKIGTAPLRPVHPAESGRAELFADVRYSGMDGSPEIFWHDPPFWNVNARLHSSLGRALLTLRPVSGFRAFSVRFHTCTPRYRSFLSISRIEDVHHACIGRVRGG